MHLVVVHGRAKSFSISPSMENTLNRSNPPPRVSPHFLPFETGANNALILDTTRLECFPRTREGFFFRWPETDGGGRKGGGMGEGKEEEGGDSAAVLPVAGISPSFLSPCSFFSSVPVSFLAVIFAAGPFVCQLDVCPD